MTFIRRHRSILIFVCILVLAGVGAKAALASWYRGWVIATVDAKEGSQVYTFNIREIPRTLPGLNDGYLYRCEVWCRGRAIHTVDCYWDSYTSETSSIEVGSGQAVYHIDHNHIRCIPFVEGADSRWESQWGAQRGDNRWFPFL